jgi:hypothetical protein
MDAAGYGVRGEVRLFQEQVKDGSFNLSLRCAARTAAGGAYSCSGLPAGKYVLFAQAALLETSPSTRALSHGVKTGLFYPYSSSLDGAELLALAPGQIQIIDLTIRPVEVHTIEIKPDPGVASLSVSIWMIGLHGERVPVDSLVGVHLRGGLFQITDVPDGTYWLEARWFRRVPHDSALLGEMGSAIVEVRGADINEARLNKQTTSTVQGVLAWDLSEHVPNRVILEKNIPGQRSRYLAEVQKNGQFAIRDIPEGNYFLSIGNGKRFFVKALDSGQGSVEGDELPVPGGSEVWLRVYASGRVGTVEGTVHGAYSGAARSEVVAESESSGEFYRAMADDSGNYIISGLPPGSYRLYAWPDGRNFPYEDEDSLRWCDGEYSEVNVPEGATVAGVEIDLSDGS